MANKFTMKILLLFFGFLTSSGVVAQVSRKPDVASSAVHPGGFQATTLLTSVINDADIVLHDVNDRNDQTELVANTNELVEMDDEVLTDTEEGEDDELDVVDEPDSGDLALGSTADSHSGKGVRARLLRFRKTDCEKKRGSGKGKKMKEGKCHTLHKKHFQSYQFSVGQQKNNKKNKDKDDKDDDYEDSTSTACRITVYHDGKCKDEASTANEGSCEDMEDAEDDDDKERRLYSRDLMSKPKGPKYNSAKFLCDGVDVSTNSSSTKSVSDYYSASSSHYSATSRYHSPTSDHYSKSTDPSKHVGGANATVMSSKSSSPSSGNSTLSSTPSLRYSKTASEDPTTTDPPEEDDDKEEPEEDPEDEEKENLDEKDEEDEPDEEDPKSRPPESQKTKTRKQKSRSHKKTKGNKKHPKKTQDTVTATRPVEIITRA